MINFTHTHESASFTAKAESPARQFYCIYTENKIRKTIKESKTSAYRHVFDLYRTGLIFKFQCMVYEKLFEQNRKL